MARLFGLSAEQVVRIRPLLPQEQGVKRVDDRKVLSGITHGTRRALRWVDAPAADGSQKALYIRCRRWSDKGALTWSFPSCQQPMPQSHPIPQSQRC